jgi:hypothetical protein
MKSLAPVVALAVFVVIVLGALWAEDLGPKHLVCALDNYPSRCVAVR